MMSAPFWPIMASAFDLHLPMAETIPSFVGWSQLAAQLWNEPVTNCLTWAFSAWSSVGWLRTCMNSLFALSKHFSSSSLTSVGVNLSFGTSGALYCPATSEGPRGGYNRTLRSTDQRRWTLVTIVEPQDLDVRGCRKRFSLFVERLQSGPTNGQLIWRSQVF